MKGMNTDVENRLYSIKEVAEILHISPSYAYQLAAGGVLPVIRIGRAIRVPSLQLNRWIDEQTEQGGLS